MGTYQRPQVNVRIGWACDVRIRIDGWRMSEGWNLTGQRMVVEMRWTSSSSGVCDTGAAAERTDRERVESAGRASLASVLGFIRP